MNANKIRKTLLGNFSDRYVLLDCQGGYCLYDKERKAPRSRYKYLGLIYLSIKDNGYVFEKNIYKDVKSLVDAIDKYNSNLPFDTDIYNPIYRLDYRIKMAVHDYLESMHFKNDTYSDGLYFLEDAYKQRIFTLNIHVNEDGSGRVFQTIKENSQLECGFTDLWSAISAVSTIVGSYLITVQSTITQSLYMMTTSRTNITKVGFNWHTLEPYSSDATEKTIELLQSEIDKLKQLKHGNTKLG